jgi:hypothetical protein
MVFAASNPLFSVPFIGIAYVWWLNAYIYEASRRAVVRMDILPHLEMVSVQRHGSFGRVFNTLHKI